MSCEHLVGFEDERRVSWALEGLSYRSCVTAARAGLQRRFVLWLSLTCSTTSGFGVIAIDRFGTPPNLGLASVAHSVAACPSIA